MARALSVLAKGLPCHVNVIPLNPTRDYAGQATTRERAEAFKTALEGYGLRIVGWRDMDGEDQS